MKNEKRKTGVEPKVFFPPLIIVGILCWLQSEIWMRRMSLLMLYSVTSPMYGDGHLNGIWW
ncbi:hypothetical protein DRW31_02225 [Shigella dysenteriae]|uniref:Uncharacterized protein n=1 Tax=Shigella dysenteriae TaxID=622 RepID=A0A3R0XBB4_SHIDY|nr:hypothetical protein [Shigella dysenteriae]MLU11278.1 hypothetical protein [Shigella dysenteriae]